MPGIIADRRTVLVSEDGHDGAVEVENSTGSAARADEGNDAAVGH